MQLLHSSSTAEIPEQNSTGSFNPVLLSFGGNLDGTTERFERALGRLSMSGFRILKRSGLFVNPAVGCEPGAADFTNLSVLGEWYGSPLELLELLHETPYVRVVERRFDFVQNTEGHRIRTQNCKVKRKHR